MKQYLEIVQEVLQKGKLKDNRTGIKTFAIAGAMFRHEMKNGFPLLTTKRVPWRLIASELEFFIKGITDKNWLIERDNHIWDEWCSSLVVPYGHSEEVLTKMKKARELGPIYGWQWRNFGAKYLAFNKKPKGAGVDQLKKLVQTLKNNPNDRRMLVSAWNPQDLPKMALPPCHYGFQVTVINDELNLLWNQRSVDVALGLPFNIASYALMLHLLAKESHLKEGVLIGFLGDVHIYENHKEGLKEQLKRKTFPLSTIKTKNFQSIFDWQFTDSQITNYQSHPTIKFKIAV